MKHYEITVKIQIETDENLSLWNGSETSEALGSILKSGELVKYYEVESVEQIR